MKNIVVTGESGAGKSSAARYLEDLGFYCIDNIPPDLIGDILNLTKENPNIERVALVADIRNPRFQSTFLPSIEAVKEKYKDLEVWYFTAEPNVIVKRFSETRRPHPLERYMPNSNILKLIEGEKELFRPIKSLADKVIDTSSMNIHELKNYIKSIVHDGTLKIKVTFLSFGFKYGIPSFADNVFDVRFLKNPHFIPELRNKTGMDKGVMDYILRFDESKNLIKKLKDFILFSIPLYEKEGKSYITFAIGCTGGQHRSVALAEILAEETASAFPNIDVYVEHREQKQRRKINR